LFYSEGLCPSFCLFHTKGPNIVQKIVDHRREDDGHTIGNEIVGELDHDACKYELAQDRKPTGHEILPQLEQEGLLNDLLTLSPGPDPVPDEVIDGGTQYGQTKRKIKPKSQRFDFMKDMLLGEIEDRQIDDHPGKSHGPKFNKPVAKYFRDEREPFLPLNLHQ
jgi:hypothetical protein